MLRPAYRKQPRPSQRRGPKPDRRRALELLASSRGCTEASDDEDFDYVTADGSNLRNDIDAAEL
jgi:hypothetical protein